MKNPWADITALIVTLAIFAYAAWRGEHPNLMELIILGGVLRISARQNI